LAACKAVLFAQLVDDPREKKLRLAIKEVALASSGKVWRGEAIFNLVHFMHIRPGLLPLLSLSIY